jgi:hypothetical protein
MYSTVLFDDAILRPPPQKKTEAEAPALICFLKQCPAPIPAAGFLPSPDLGCSPVKSIVILEAEAALKKQPCQVKNG